MAPVKPAKQGVFTASSGMSCVSPVDKKTIAEFVENSFILGKLRELGVDYVQGYGIGRPQPLNDLISKGVLHVSKTNLGNN